MGTTQNTQFHIRSIPFCPRAQRAMLALAARGTRWTQENFREQIPARGDLPQLIVTRDGYLPDIIGKSLLMVETIEALHPDQPLFQADPDLQIAERALMEVGRGLQIRLSAVTHAVESNEHDFAVHRLRERLTLVERTIAHDPGVTQSPLGNAGVVFGPTLWRIELLDRLCETYLLAGLPNLTAWTHHLAAHPAMKLVFGDGARAIYLSSLKRRGTVLVSQADSLLWDKLPIKSGPYRGAG